jgi:uncharacterized repeat protein (TIGR01451 family)
MTKNHLPNQPGTIMKHDQNKTSIEQLGRALLLQSAKKIRKSENSKLRRVSAGSLAMAVAAMQIIPAFATINNTVTASGKGPGGVTVSGSAPATVDVINAAPAIKVVKTASFALAADDVNGNGLADPGDKVTYLYKVSNTGNVTVKTVTVTDAHDGAGTAPVVVVPTSVTTDNGSAAAGTINDSTDPVTTDANWGILGPADVITFKSTYVVVAADIAAAGGGTGTGLSTLPEPDGYIDNTATVKASYNDGVTTTNVTGTSRANIKLNIVNALVVTKTPDLTTNVAAGTPVTYTYTVTNNGTTPILNINLVDTHNASGAAPIPIFQSFTTNLGGSTNTGNTITKLMPGDVAKYTAQYIVTQADVDSLQ